MRLCFLACAAAAGRAAAPVSAATLLPARLTIDLDPVLTTGVQSSADRLTFDLPVSNFRFDGQVRGNLGATEANPDGELGFALEVSGEVFPKISFTGQFSDYGAPSTFAITVTLPFPAIPGSIDYAVFGEIENAEGNGTPVSIIPGQNAFFGFFVNGDPLTSLGIIPVPGGVTVSASGSGSIECAFAPGGACTQMSTLFIGKGPGDGQFFRVASTYDLDTGVTLPPVPLPASLGLLLAGLGGLAVAARRTRA